MLVNIRLKHLVLCNWQLYSQNKCRCLDNSESARRGAASGLSIHASRVQSSLQLGRHGLPARLQPLTLHTVRGIATHPNKLSLTLANNGFRHITIICWSLYITRFHDYDNMNLTHIEMVRVFYNIYMYSYNKWTHSYLKYNKNKYKVSGFVPFEKISKMSIQIAYQNLFPSNSCDQTVSVSAKYTLLIATITSIMYFWFLLKTHIFSPWKERKSRVDGMNEWSESHLSLKGTS